MGRIRPIFNKISNKAKERAAFTKKIRKASKIGIKKNENVLYDLASKHNVKILKMRQGLTESKDWLDHCHLSSKGETKKAQFYLAT